MKQEKIDKTDKDKSFRLELLGKRLRDKGSVEVNGKIISFYQNSTLVDYLFGAVYFVTVVSLLLFSDAPVYLLCIVPIFVWSNKPVFVHPLLDGRVLSINVNTLEVSILNKGFLLSGIFAMFRLDNPNYFGLSNVSNVTVSSSYQYSNHSVYLKGIRSKHFVGNYKDRSDAESVQKFFTDLVGIANLESKT